MNETTQLPTIEKPRGYQALLSLMEESFLKDAFSPDSAQSGYSLNQRQIFSKEEAQVLVQQARPVLTEINGALLAALESAQPTNGEEIIQEIKNFFDDREEESIYVNRAVISCGKKFLTDDLEEGSLKIRQAQIITISLQRLFGDYKYLPLQFAINSNVLKPGILKPDESDRSFAKISELEELWNRVDNLRRRAQENQKKEANPAAANENSNVDSGAKNPLAFIRKLFTSSPETEEVSEASHTQKIEGLSKSEVEEMFETISSGFFKQYLLSAYYSAFKKMFRLLEESHYQYQEQEAERQRYQDIQLERKKYQIFVEMHQEDPNSEVVMLQPLMGYAILKKRLFYRAEESQVKEKYKVENHGSAFPYHSVKIRSSENSDWKEIMRVYISGTQVENVMEQGGVAILMDKSDKTRAVLESIGKGELLDTFDLL